ncbi:glycerophosphodiester phosphodiesterase family protein [Hellea balneolensis]|uniref:glycerophosphodiester phosphodiesterase family protein n=1 Tax=Hellea balneolensis TaxID=287478 RepID=UPI00047E153F|nr:glycerophosphodiester phosphodiesterase family protein [Hellea balneolensis]
MRNFKAPLTITLAAILTACGQSSETTSVSKQSQTSVIDANTALPPLASYMSCLPQETALVAAHRGTARNSDYPENSMSGLNLLIEKGFLVSEVDVAGLKDGTHILYHDGVWDEKSTGKGAIASTTWDEASTLLLMDTKGNFSADRPVKFDDYLKAAKGKIYLEVDFKSSSKYETVLELIRENDMAKDVILISYNERQTEKLMRLAPDMMLSVGPNEALGQTRFKPGQIAAWIGYNVDDAALVNNLRDKDIPILGRVRKDWSLQAADAADLLVTDDIFDHNPIAGLTNKNKEELEACLSSL